MLVTPVSMSVTPVSTSVTPVNMSVEPWLCYTLTSLKWCAVIWARDKSNFLHPGALSGHFIPTADQEAETRIHSVTFSGHRRSTDWLYKSRKRQHGQKMSLWSAPSTNEITTTPWWIFFRLFFSCGKKLIKLYQTWLLIFKFLCLRVIFPVKVCTAIIICNKYAYLRQIISGKKRLNS